jgi:hypothetical protein
VATDARGLSQRRPRGRAGSFTAFAAANPDDLVAGLYLERLAELGEAASVGWDPVVNFHSKG